MPTNDDSQPAWARVPRAGLRASLAGALVLSACSYGREEPIIIDGSSKQAFEQTLSEAKRELGPGDRVKFETALAEFRAQMFAKADTRQEYERLVRRGMNGLTAPRIVAKFNSNVDKFGRDAADAVFDAKRAVAGHRSGAEDAPQAPSSVKLKRNSAER